MDNMKKIFLIIILLLICGLSFGLYYYYNKTEDLNLVKFKMEQNNVALGEEVKQVEGVNSNLEASKAIYIGKIGDLKTNNDLLKDEVKEFEGEIGSLTVTLLQLKDSIKGLKSEVTYPTEKNDSTYKIEWSYVYKYDQYNGRSIIGYSKFRLNKENFKIYNVKSELTKDIINIKLTQGLRKREDGLVEMFIKSKYKGLNVKDMQSVIDPETHPVFARYKKNDDEKINLGFGLYSGYGLTYISGDGTIVNGVQVGGGLIISF